MHKRMQLSKVLIISLPIALTLLAGCASAPPYQRPAIALPAQFKQATAAAQDAGIWRPVQPQDAPAPEAWWRLYADPDLDRLQQQAEAIRDDSESRFYNGEKTKLTTSSSRSLTVDGLPAWEIKFQVRISYLDNIPGDNVEVLVVQHTDGSRSGLLTFATIGDTETQRQVDGSRAGVRVEKR